MKVSIIIPTYKPKDYFWKCLESVAEQTFPKDDFEVIIVLNGCCDPWKTQIESYISDKMDELNVNFIQTDKGGVSYARNLALDVAKGDYITFLDDDDFISPSYIEELYENADPNTVSLCYPLSFEDGTENYKPYYVTSNFREEKDMDYPFMTAKKYFSGPVYKLINKDIIGRRRFDESLTNGEDAVFMFLISDRLKRVKFTSKEAIYYRRVRRESAQFRKKSGLRVISHMMHMIGSYTKTYLRHPLSYNVFFYITRILAAFHFGIEQFRIKMN